MRKQPIDYGGEEGKDLEKEGKKQLLSPVLTSLHFCLVIAALHQKKETFFFHFATPRLTVEGKNKKQHDLTQGADDRRLVGRIGRGEAAP